MISTHVKPSLMIITHAEIFSMKIAVSVISEHTKPSLMTISV